MGQTSVPEIVLLQDGVTLARKQAVFLHSLMDVTYYLNLQFSDDYRKFGLLFTFFFHFSIVSLFLLFLRIF